MITAGIDIGSTMTKVVILEKGETIASRIQVTGSEHRHLAHQVLAKALDDCSLEVNRLNYIVGTGYGRLNIPFADRQVTEISCHGKAIAHLFPQAKTVIEIGGQDTKVIKLDRGKIVDFAMNDKCAAGTGRFLQIVAEMLDMGLAEMSASALSATDIVPIKNFCAVFAQHEIIALLSKDVAVESILAGLFQSFARRIVNLAKQKKVAREVVLSGGGAKYPVLKAAVEQILGYTVLLPEEPFLTGAYGAAIIAAEQAVQAPSKNKTYVLSRVDIE